MNIIIIYQTEVGGVGGTNRYRQELFYVALALQMFYNMSFALRLFTFHLRDVFMR